MSSDHELLISLVVVTRNEEDHIQRCLESMLRQSLPPATYEIIVVDGMSSDGTRKIVQRVVEDHPDRSIRLLDNPRLILSSGWNIGIESACGRYVVRPDAHAEVPKDFLEKSIAVIEAHPEAAAVGGVIETKGEGFWGETIAALLSSRVGVGGSSFRVGGRAGPRHTVVYGLYKRDELVQVGGFDESLRLNQDIVCHARLRAAGKTLYFDPTIRSTYRCRNSLVKLARQMFRVGQWLMLLLRHRCGRVFSLRYYAPLAFVLTIVALLAGGLWYGWLWLLLGGLLATYTAVGLVAALRRNLRPIQVLLFPLAMSVLHISYGVGEIAGLLCLPFHRPRNDRSRASGQQGALTET